LSEEQTVKSWELMVLSCNELSPSKFAGSMNIDGGRILIFGGQSIEPTSTCFELDPSKSTITRSLL